MKDSELIIELQKMIDKHGDISVMLSYEDLYEEIEKEMFEFWSSGTGSVELDTTL